MGGNNISLVIRTLNERNKLAALLKDISGQEGMQPEIIVVDNESTDGTPELAEKFGCKLVNIPRQEFTFPRSLNLGMQAASHEVVILTVGHARLFRPDWLNTAVTTFEDPKVAGLYAPVIPLEGCSLVETLFYWPGYIQARIRGPYMIRMRVMGVLGATNAAIRKSLWAKHPFDESYESGGEDGEWAAWVMDQGFAIMCDWRFSVRHSHELGLAGLKQQIRYWADLAQPKKLDLEVLKSFRRDIKWD